MVATRFSSDVLEIFYGPISQEENARIEPPLIPRRGNFDFIFFLFYSAETPHRNRTAQRG